MRLMSGCGVPTRCSGDWIFFFSSRRRHTRCSRDWSSDVCSSDLTRNDRWASPKFLIGESYGTTRSAELAGVLQERHQIYLSGIVLLSSVAFSNWGADNRFEFFLPTYVTTAWYHH